MSDAGAGASGAGAVGDGDAASTVASLLALRCRMQEARTLQRRARALELAERALELAQRTLPHNSLITASLLGEVVAARAWNDPATLAAAGMPRAVELIAATWVSDARIRTLSHGRLAVCCTRLLTDSLCTLTPEEHAYFSAAKEVPPLATLGEELLLSAAAEALSFWPTDGVAEFQLLMVGVRGALDAALSLDARGALEPAVRQRKAVRAAVVNLLLGVLGNDADAQRMLRALRTFSSSMSLSADAEAALRRLQARLQNLLQVEDLLRWNEPALAASRQRAEADVALHGLRACALPSCGATEPQPRFFKRCGACRRVVYCCAEHQRADWPRHKREGGCRARGAAA